MSGIRPPHRSRFRRPQHVRVADDVVHLGLPEHLVDRHAERVARPFEHGRADRLSRAHHAAQPKIEPLARPRTGLHHHLERRGEQERVAHAVLRHQRERALRIESAAVADDRLAEVQRRAAARPSGRRSRPNRRATRTDRLRADNRRASGRIRAGCRAGTDAASARPSAVPSCRSCRRGVPDRWPRCRRTRTARALSISVSYGVIHASLAPATPTPRGRREALADRREIRHRLRVDERDVGLGIDEPVLERIGAEQERQRHGDRAELVDRDVGDDRLGPLRQDQRDLVARFARPGPRAHSRTRFACCWRSQNVYALRRARLVFPVQRKARAIVRPSGRNTRARC